MKTEIVSDGKRAFPDTDGTHLYAYKVRVKDSHFILTDQKAIRVAVHASLTLPFIQ